MKKLYLSLVLSIFLIPLATAQYSRPDNVKDYADLLRVLNRPGLKDALFTIDAVNRQLEDSLLTEDVVRGLSFRVNEPLLWDISPGTEFELSFDEFNELQDLLDHYSFIWWPNFDIYDSDNNLLGSLGMCVADNPVRIDINSFVFPQTIDDVKYSQCLDNISYLLSGSSGTVVKYVENPKTKELVPTFATKVKTDIRGFFSFGADFSFDFSLRGDKVIGIFSPGSHASARKLILSSCPDHASATLALLKEKSIYEFMETKRSEREIADFLSVNNSPYDAFNRAKKYFGEESVNYVNSRGNSVAAEVYLDGLAYDIDDDEMIDFMALPNFNPKAFSAVVASSKSLKKLTTYEFSVLFIKLLAYLEREGPSSTNALVQAIIHSDYAYYSDLSKEAYRFSDGDTFLVAYAMLDLLYQQYTYPASSSKASSNSEGKVGYKRTLDDIYSAITAQNTPLRMSLCVSGLFYQYSSKSNSYCFWMPEKKLEMADDYYKDELVKEAFRAYIHRMPWMYRYWFKVMKSHNTCSGLKNELKSMDMKGCSKDQKKSMKKAIKYAGKECSLLH